MVQVVVRRCRIWSVFDKETGMQLSYDCAREEEAIEEMKRIKREIKEGKVVTSGA